MGLNKILFVGALVSSLLLAGCGAKGGQILGNLTDTGWQQEGGNSQDGAGSAPGVAHQEVGQNFIRVHTTALVIADAGTSGRPNVVDPKDLPNSHVEVLRDFTFRTDDRAKFMIDDRSFYNFCQTASGGQYPRPQYLVQNSSTNFIVVPGTVFELEPNRDYILSFSISGLSCLGYSAEFSFLRIR